MPYACKACSNNRPHPRNRARLCGYATYVTELYILGRQGSPAVLSPGPDGFPSRAFAEGHNVSSFYYDAASTTAAFDSKIKLKPGAGLSISISCAKLPGHLA